VNVNSWHEPDQPGRPDDVSLHFGGLGYTSRRARRQQMEIEVAQKTKKKIVRREYTKAEVKELRSHSKAKTPLAEIMKLTKRTEGSLRQKALKLGIGLGHQR
jgi:hypothetical protein